MEVLILKKQRYVTRSMCSSNRTGKRLHFILLLQRISRHEGEMMPIFLRRTTTRRRLRLSFLCSETKCTPVVRIRKKCTSQHTQSVCAPPLAASSAVVNDIVQIMSHSKLFFFSFRSPSRVGFQTEGPGGRRGGRRVFSLQRLGGPGADDHLEEDGRYYHCCVGGWIKGTKINYAHATSSADLISGERTPWNSPILRFTGGR